MFKSDLSINQLSGVIEEKVSSKKTVWLALIGILLVASLIPFTNLVLPAILNSSSTGAGVEKFLQSIPDDQKENVKLISSKLLYPYYNENGVINFSLIVENWVMDYSINTTHQPLQVVLQGGEDVIVGVQEGVNNSTVKYIYQQKGNSLEEIWECNLETCSAYPTCVAFIGYQSNSKCSPRQ